MLLGAGAALDQHREVKPLGREPFQRVLADSPEAVLVDHAEQAILQVRVAHPAGIVIAQHALRYGRRAEPRPRH